MKKVVLRLFVAVEIVVLSHVYLFGKSGLYVLEQSKDQVKKVEQEIENKLHDLENS